MSPDNGTTQTHNTVDSTGRGTIEVKVVDTDVHPVPRGLDEFFENYPEPYRSRYFAQYAQDTPLSFLLYTPHSNLGGNQGMGGPGGYAVPPNGGGSGSDPDFLARQLCVDHKTDYCLLNPLFFRPRHWDAEWDAAHAAATNNWLAKHWLDGSPNRHGRFFGALQITSMDPNLAAREIERWAGHPAFRQVYLLADSLIAFGNPHFEKVWETAAKHGLPVGTHLFRHSGIRSLTPVGFPSYHVEVLPNWIFTYISHVTSVVFEGIFDRYPNMKFACIEGGAEWVAPMMWRLDRQWEKLRQEVPQSRTRPSELIRKHVRFATQPLCEPPRSADLTRFFEWASAGETIMFSSDYPHYDFDSAPWVEQQFPEAWRARIMGKNAVETYGMPEFRPHDYLDDIDAGNVRMRAGERRFRALSETNAASVRNVRADMPYLVESTD